MVESSPPGGLKVHTLLVTGGYGFFGERICDRLAASPQLRLIVAPPRESKARQLAADLGDNVACGIGLDVSELNLSKELKLGLAKILSKVAPTTAIEDQNK